MNLAALRERRAELALDQELALHQGELSRLLGVELSLYRSDTLARAVERRQQVWHSGTLDDYLHLLRHHPEEPAALRRLVLVSLSWFYRDLPVWATLERLLQADPPVRARGRPLRIWVPGCASGQECFTLALLAQQVLARHGGDAPAVEVIGSDINPAAICAALRAVYAPDDLRELDSHRRERLLEPDSLDVRAPWRAMCRFQLEDVLQCEPPAEVDIVSCRNLLIYLNPQGKERLLERLHQALRPGGWLLLGRSERLAGPHTAGLLAADERHRLYRRRAWEGPR